MANQLPKSDNLNMVDNSGLLLSAAAMLPPGRSKGKTVIRKKDRKRKAPQSAVWRFFFKIKQGGNHLAVCHSCKWTTKLYGSSTSNMRRHLEKKHNLDKDSMDLKMLDRHTFGVPENHGGGQHIASPGDVPGSHHLHQIDTSFNTPVRDSNNGVGQLVSGSSGFGHSMVSGIGRMDIPGHERDPKRRCHNQMAMSTHKSSVWKHFTRVENGKNVIAICEICQWTSKLYGSSTSNIRRHLIKIHGMQEEINNASVAQKKNTIAYVAVPFLQWMAATEQRFTTLDNTYFKDVLAKLGIKRTPVFPDMIPILEATYANARQRMKHVLASSCFSKLSIMIDSWSEYTFTGYVSIRAQWVDANWKVQCLLLSCLPREQVLSPKALCDHLLRLVTEFDISDKIHSFTTADDPVVTRAIALLEQCTNNALSAQGKPTCDFSRKHIKCLVHVVHRTIDEAQHFAFGVVAKLAKIMDLYYSNSTFRNCFNFEQGSQQERDRGGQLAMPPFCNLNKTTDWKEKLKVLTTIYRQMDLFNSRVEHVVFLQQRARDGEGAGHDDTAAMLAALPKLKPITETDWQTVKVAIKFFQIGSCITEFMGNAPTVSMLVPLVTALKSKCAEITSVLEGEQPATTTSERVPGHAMLGAAMESIVRSLDALNETLQAPDMRIAKLIDPRVRVSPDEIDEAERRLCDLVSYGLDDSSPVGPRVGSDGSNGSRRGSSADLSTIPHDADGSKEGMNLFDMYNKNIEEKENETAKAASKVSQFINTRLDSRENLFAWWERNQGVFPGFANAARDVLSAACFSIPLSMKRVDQQVAISNRGTYGGQVVAMVHHLKHWNHFLSQNSDLVDDLQSESDQSGQGGQGSIDV